MRELNMIYKKQIEQTNDYDVFMKIVGYGVYRLQGLWVGTDRETFDETEIGENGETCRALGIDEKGDEFVIIWDHLQDPHIQDERADCIVCGRHCVHRGNIEHSEGREYPVSSLVD